MRVNKLDLNLLLVFDVIVAEGSVTKAATRLCLSQAAISNALGRLRSHFDDDLVVLSKGALSLTPFGQAIREEVKTLVQRAQQLADARLNFDPAMSTRTFRIGVSEYTAQIFMGEVTRAVAEDAPGVRVDLCAPAPDPQAALDRGELDFVILPKSRLARQYPFQELYHDEFVCIAWSGHKAPGDILTLEEYTASGHVILRPTNRDIASGTFANVHSAFVDRVVLSTPYQSIVPHLIVGTKLLGCVHRQLALRISDELPITILSLPFESPPLTLCAYWAAARSVDPAHVWLRNLISKAAEKLSVPLAELDGLVE